MASAAPSGITQVSTKPGQVQTRFYARKKDGHLGAAGLRRMRQLEDENVRLKRLVTDMTLAKHMLAEALRKTV